ncbi:MAG: hypothetical protein QGG19_13525 [Alphaproteobacteria bacterium]|nr:hypothetical protein [Alphaproteobacteria bacterium]MDP6256376.1 hypothetical protein [Alphaproteobacteria bacterium]MDP7053095.1 hypothetical protein [Alphaproteobacteria bacterium]MDP7228164.1 hypothetical protein [Alphaproteobacteria bacterium]MDP7459124.1 hypothetical protein [Alphaproteobacteria bacterium]
MNRVGFNVRVAKDETQVYKSMVLNDIRRFADTPVKDSITREFQE